MVSAHARLVTTAPEEPSLRMGRSLPNRVGVGGGGRGNLSSPWERLDTIRLAVQPRQHGHELPAFESRVQLAAFSFSCFMKSSVVRLIYHRYLRKATASREGSLRGG